MGLFELVGNNDIEGVKKVIAAGADLEIRHNYEWTPLQLAAYRAHTEIAEALINAGANVNATNRDGWTPLHFAVRQGCYKIAQMLISAGAKPLKSTYGINNSDCKAFVGLLGGVEGVDIGWCVRTILNNPEILKRATLDEKTIARLLLISEGKIAEYLNLQTN